MKILFSSYTFAPNVGGIESVSVILAEKFVEAGHEVHVITETPEKENAEHRTPNAEHQICKVTRRPSLPKLLSLLSCCDVVFQNNITLRSLIPALLMRKSVIVVHQTWLRKQGGAVSSPSYHERRTGDRRSLKAVGWNNRLKRALLSCVTNVAISSAIRDDLCRAGAAPALQSLIRIIGNPYDDRVFRLRPEIPRDKTLVFVGRLVSDKGVDLLLQAMKILQTPEENAQHPMAKEGQVQHHAGLQPDLTIVGAGPEEENLRRITREFGLHRQVTFAGQKSGDELAGLLNRHRILIVPSRWPEPFGIVALEGIACGCAVVGSRDGGLPEAIGPCGVTFENGDETALAECLKELLLDPEKTTALRENASAHLAKFRADTVANAYLELLGEAAH